MEMRSEVSDFWFLVSDLYSGFPSLAQTLFVLAGNDTQS